MQFAYITAGEPRGHNSARRDLWTERPGADRL